MSSLKLVVTHAELARALLTECVEAFTTGNDTLAHTRAAGVRRALLNAEKDVESVSQIIAAATGGKE